jgi:predicted nucleic acid-binding protein
MAERVTLDSNVLVYAFDDSEPDKQPIANQVLWLAHDANAILTTIVLGEFFWVMARKAIVSDVKARGILADLITLFPVAGYGTDTLESAALAVAGGRFSFWDAVMLSAAEEAGCSICFSEDMKDGTRLGNITVRNPFARRGLSRAARDVFGLR